MSTTSFDAFNRAGQTAHSWLREITTARWTCCRTSFAGSCGTRSCGGAPSLPVP
ncbi:hypothetical protein [Virgisporangium ochraceum]|uniref:hypothetical protein n=1 Tax=Virgisporangium ochraceum TaxID=65505 RepID=UPI001941BA3F|nr:hypothetical protein [Virgisporangium ochraceum]